MYIDSKQKKTEVVDRGQKQSLHYMTKTFTIIVLKQSQTGLQIREV